MKLSSKILNLVIISSLILMISCGKKKPGGVPPYGYGYGGFTGPGGGNIQNYVNTLPCGAGMPGIPQEGRFEHAFNIQGISYSGTFNKTNIQGNLRPGLVPGAAVTGSFVGRSSRNDLIIIEKISTGPSVSGFNIRLLLCPYIVSGVPVLNSERVRLSLTTMNPPAILAAPIVVTENTGCPMAGVDSATIILYLPQYQYLNPAAWPISFAFPGC